MKLPTPKKLHWLEVAQITAVVSSVGGSIAGVLLKQFLWATVPLSAAAGLSIANHRRLQQMIEQDRRTISTLVQENKAAVSELETKTAENHQEYKINLAELDDELGQVRNLATTELARLQQEKQEELENTALKLSSLQTAVAKLDQLSHELEQNVNTVDDQQKETGKLVRELKAIDVFTQNIKANLNTVQSYFQRGYTYQRLGDKQQAIDDYGKTLELDSSHAQAYHNRGLLYAELGMAQKAVIDLRKASQLYINKGNLDKYRETRDLSLNVHQESLDLATEIKEKETESVSVGNFFG